MIRLVVALAVVTTACVGNIQRSARVPHASVPLSSGQPLNGTEVSLGLSNATDLVQPEVGNSQYAVETPQVQARGEVRLKAGSRTTIAGIYEHGFGSTKQVPDSTQAPVGEGDLWGLGASVTYSIDTNRPGFTIALTAELMEWNVPYVEYETDNFANNTVIDKGRTSVGTFGFGVAPSYRTGSVTLFGGVFARNHPVTQRKSFDVFLDSSHGDVENGPLNVLVHAGLEVALTKQLSWLVSIHQDLVAAPLQYGPGVGIGLAVHGE